MLIDKVRKSIGEEDCGPGCSGISYRVFGMQSSSSKIHYLEGFECIQSIVK